MKEWKSIQEAVKLALRKIKGRNDSTDLFTNDWRIGWQRENGKLWAQVRTQLRQACWASMLVE